MANIWLAILLAIPALVLSSLESPDLQVDVLECQPTYILVGWNATEKESIDSYAIQVEDNPKESRVTYELGLPYIDTENSQAKVHVHSSDHHYNICVIARLSEEATIYLNITEVAKCVEAATIRSILPISLVALLLTLGFFILCIMTGYIAWKCSARRSKPKDYEKPEENGNGDIVPLTHIED